MMTSLNNTRLIEKYILGTLSSKDKLVFEARLLLNPMLRMDLHFQKKTYKLIKMYHREKLKDELETLNQRIFSDPDKIIFQQNIFKLFK